MVRVKPILFFASALFLFSTKDAEAQNPPDYSFYASSKTYTPISGGVIPKSPSNGSFTGDEERTINPIGFPFNFCGTDYSQTCASTNLWMSFKTPTDPGSHEYFDNTSAYANDVNAIGPCLMPFFDDMYGRASASAYYKTTGRGRNRVFTFEWKNWGFFSGSVDNSVSVQVKLYEYGAIEYLYQQESNNPPAYPNTTDLLGATIGFAKSTTASEYQTLNNLTSSPTSSSTTFYTDLNPRPATGQSYMWFYKDNSNNAGTLEVSSPTIPFCVGEQTIRATIMNFGKNKINNVTVHWEVDGIQKSPVTFSNVIDTFGSSAGHSAVVTLGIVNFSVPHTIKVYTSYPNGQTDPVTKNDTLVQYLSPSPLADVTASGPTIFCTAGAINVTLNTNNGAGNIYQWFKNGSPVPGATTSSLTVTVPGDYTVKIDSNGCSNTSANTRVENLALPLPVVTPSGYPLLCDSVTLVANAGITGASYQWQRQGVNIPGATNASYTATQPGNYTVITSKYTCAATSPGINLVATPKPTPQISKSVSDPIVLTTATTYTYYQWQLDGNDIPGANTFAYLPKQNGSYTVKVKNSDCEAISDPEVVSEVGISNVKSLNNAVNIYPNPATSVLNIDAPDHSQIRIFSFEGKLVADLELVKGKIDIKNLPAGVYTIKIISASDVLSISKIIKQ